MKVVADREARLEEGALLLWLLAVASAQAFFECAAPQ